MSGTRRRHSRNAARDGGTVDQELHRVVSRGDPLRPRSAGPRNARPADAPPVRSAVRSITASRLPRRSPERVAVSSRLRRVAASICITESGATRIGGARCSEPPASPGPCSRPLRQRDVIDQRPGRGDLGAAELAEPVERLDAVELFEPPARRLAVEARIGERGQRRLSTRRTARTAPGAPAAAPAPGSRPGMIRARSAASVGSEEGASANAPVERSSQASPNSPAASAIPGQVIVPPARRAARPRSAYRRSRPARRRA